MTSQTPIRTVLFGYGLGGRLFHAPFLSALPEFSLDAVVTANAERASQAVDDHAARVLASADEVWSRADEFDLAVISTANAVHVELATAALELGLDVVVDKPLCGDAATGRVLAQLARERGRSLVTFQNRRWDGDFLTLQKLIAQGDLGEVHRFESRFERFRPEPKAGFRESADPADLGGLLYDLGSHLLDQALVLLGSATHVYTELDCRRPGVVVDDDVFVAVTHENGAVSHHWMSVMAAALGPRFRALGSRGAYVINSLDPQEEALRMNVRSVPVPGDGLPWGVREDEEHGWLYTGHSGRVIETLPGDYRKFWTGLAGALTEGAPSPVPIEQTIALLELIDAVRESARLGEVVALS